MAGIAIELVLVLAIVYLPLGQTIFSTAPLGWEPWLLILACAAAFLLLEEMRKFACRRMRDADSRKS